MKRIKYIVISEMVMGLESINERERKRYCVIVVKWKKKLLKLIK